MNVQELGHLFSGHSWWHLGLLPDVTGPWDALLEQMHVGQSRGAVHLGGRNAKGLAQPVLGGIEVMRIGLSNLGLILAGGATRIRTHASHQNNGQNGGKQGNNFGESISYQAGKQH